VCERERERERSRWAETRGERTREDAGGVGGGVAAELLGDAKVDELDLLHGVDQDVLGLIERSV
jgi:hypothetical protein